MGWKRSLPSQVDFAEIGSPPSAAFLSQPPHSSYMSRCLRLSPNNSYLNCKINSNFVWRYINLYQTHCHNNIFVKLSIIDYTALFVVSPYCNLYLVLQKKLGGVPDRFACQPSLGLLSRSTATIYTLIQPQIGFYLFIFPHS